MSLPPQVNKPAKHRPMKEPVHPAEVYYGLGPPALDHPDMNAGSSGAYNTDKLPPNMGHYHQPQPGPVKWMHQDAPLQASGWAQEAPPLPGWGQSFAPSYMGGVNVRGFHKGVHEGLPMGAETQMQEVFRDNAQWEPMHQIQSYPHQPQQTMQPQTMQTMQTQAQTMQTQAQTMQTQAQTMHPQTMQPQTMQAPMLQPFQTFRQNKPQQAQFNPGYYQGFAQKPSAQMQSLGYGEQPKQQQQQPSLLQQIQQQQQQQIQLQQLQMQQHLQQQQQRQLQTQYQQQQQQPPQHVQERHMQPMSHQPTQQDVQITVAAPKLNFATFERQETNLEPPRPELTETGPRLEKPSGAAYEAASAVESPPRRSRRLSREGQSPSAEQPQNGLTAAGPRAEGVTGGVIQSTRTRRRRASKEINLETLAQQAAKRESLPAKGKDDASSGRQSSMAPLVIPVSVPVPRAQQQGAPGGQQPEGAWSSERPRTSERGAGQSLHKASVIVARRRSLRNSVNERTLQDGENDSGTDEDGKPRPKRRPRPEPLIIPPPRPSSFIPASVYSSITPYQSHLRSPVHPLDHPVMLPPYTPPPILSPVRAGSGLYFSTFLSNMAAAGTQAPPAITKSVSVSLLRLSSAESTPPLTIVTDATPVSLEPRINIGQQYQAEIPELLSRSSSQQEQHRADLLWLPMEHLQHGAQDRVRDLMNMACSSVLSGGGTNQELVLHCLFQSRGDVLQTLERLMLQDVLFPKGHPLCNYHYSGSDSWSPEEKRYFNKGISAYRKDFIMVQKLVQTKSVAQCVEFYYTYKKQVKVGRSGTLTFGPADVPPHSHEEVIDNKSSQQPRADLNEAELNHQPEPPSEPSAESSHQARVAQSLQAHDYAVPAPAPDPQPVVSQPPLQTSAPPRPRSEPQAKKGKAPPKPPADPDQVFPCKKCGRVFYKVKSRSAHMKSHAEQEKKAAALRQKEQEDQLQTRTVPAPEPRPGPRRAEASDQSRARASGLYQEQGSGAESSEADDAADEDWH